ncbi:MAG: MCE family protein, partial [Nocardioidaceae bacterium]|nr:MCE family protein [Nocardioidaceae bacterium]
MTGLRLIALKFAAFGVVSVVMLMLLVNTMQNGVSGDTKEYTADFADVNGLRKGDDVKAAGVRVGLVKDIAATDEGARITIKVESDQPIYSTTQLKMRYQNLLGQRYIGMSETQEKSARGKKLDSGGNLPIEQTDPGFDLTNLLNGFKPLFDVLQPSDVNALAGSLTKVLQGEGGSVEQLLQQTGQLSNFLADRDDIIGEVMTNLQPVLENLAGQDDNIT